MKNLKPSAQAGFFQKAWWFLRHRPTLVFAQIRTLFTFWWTHQLLQLLPTPGLKLAPNVRVQRFRSLMAEAPLAQITIGAHTLVFEHAILEAHATGQIAVGEDSILSDIRIYSRGKIRIGKRFLGSWNVFIQDYSPHPVDSVLRGEQTTWATRHFAPNWSSQEERNVQYPQWDFAPGSIDIGDDVWICAQSTILKDVSIGDGCIVAANSVVTAGQYPAHSLIAGNPAKVIKSLK